MNYITKLVIFFLLNFAALGIGGIFTAKAVNGPWYLSLEKAPWTPPGWVFGAAWTLIMITFSFFMAQITPEVSSSIFKSIIIIYLFQWVLNVIWNPIFFKYHEMLLGLLVIMMLTLVVAYLMYYGFKTQEKYYVLLILPYFLWLCIASSLNAYAYFKN